MSRISETAPKAGPKAWPKAELAAAAIAALILSACSSGKRPRVAPAAAPASAQALEDVWHLRSALNVAALNCRGRGIANVGREYNRMLSVHRTILASAAQAEQARYPGLQYDTHVTEVFNRYSLIRNHRLYCAQAQEIVGRVNAASSREIVRMAPGALNQLEAAQRRR